MSHLKHMSDFADHEREAIIIVDALASVMAKAEICSPDAADLAIRHLWSPQFAGRYEPYERSVIDAYCSLLMQATKEDANG